MLIYIGDLERLFAGARRALASDGLFAFSIELSPEGDDGPPFALRPSLRYAHSARYIRELAARHGFEVVRSVQETMREDRREAVRRHLLLPGRRLSAESPHRRSEDVTGPLFTGVASRHHRSRRTKGGGP